MDVLLSSAFMIMAGFAAVAGVARGLAGFGVGLIMMPLGAVLLTPQVMVPVIALIDIPVALYLMGSAWRDFDRRGVFPLIAAAALFMPLGVYALTVVDGVTLSIVVNVLAFLAAVALLAGSRIKGGPSLGRTLGTGALAGLLQGSVSLPGPPIILGWVAAQVPGPVLRANIIVFFLFIDVVVVPMHWAAGLFTEHTLILAAGFLPIFFGGTVIGRHLFGRVPEVWFRRVVLGLVIAGALAGIATAFR
jgi:uncharacterized membrane protein YfcA